VRLSKLDAAQAPVLIRSCGQDGIEIDSIEGFLEKAEYPAAVDGVQGGFHIGEAGEHDPDRVGELFAAALEKADAVFPGHAHVRDDDSEGLVLTHHFQGLAG
jgi:glycine/D-amino acid oxidase-like deaminating enzyme